MTHHVIGSPTPNHLEKSVPQSANAGVMQSLWSRAGQAHRCGCRGCSTAVEALGRRATATTRRRPTFAETFTACYSSVFATAALVDAIRKDNRRQELDRQLEEARQDLADLQEQRSTSSNDVDSKPQNLTLQQMDALWKSLKIIYNNRPFMKEIHRPATISTSDLIERLKRDYYGCPSEASFGAARQTDYERLERAIMSEELDKQMIYREPSKQTHLLMETISAEDVVRKLLDRAKFLPRSTSPSPSFEEARRMRKKGYPNFTFRSIDPDGAQKNTTALNQRLRELIGMPDMNMKERIGRICYNLLISSHPPDMHTYNTLIVAFNKSGHHTFAEALVSSFFHSRLLQPTPSTFVVILNHYKCTNNHGKFLRAIACLTGLESTIGEPLLQKWAADVKRRTHTGEWVWEHIPLNQPLVEEIISGLLHFNLFDQAASFFVSSMRLGVKLSIDIVKHLMDECINAMDWKAAVRMVRAFTNSSGKWQRALLVGDEESKAYIASRMHVLIDICGLNGPLQPIRGFTLINLDISNFKFERFLKLLEEEAPLRKDSLALYSEFDASKSRLLQLESLSREVDFVRKTTSSIESKLLYPDFPHPFRISMARHIGTSAMRRSLQLNQEFRTLIADSSNQGQGSTPGLLERCEEFETSTEQSLDMSIDDPSALETRSRLSLSLDTISESKRSHEKGESHANAESTRTQNQTSSLENEEEPRLETGSRPRPLLTWPVSRDRAAVCAEAS
ncbi:hypothetical protein PT974_00270 [Cladobotryum mycophilum]|uniref:Pentatricopeptide repeat protein n=1 Tax=Cladobotryum mycophilum TaxID=491253 RepID=A0ABR0T0E3_9HYPO